MRKYAMALVASLLLGCSQAGDAFGKPPGYEQLVSVTVQSTANEKACIGTLRYEGYSAGLLSEAQQRFNSVVAGKGFGGELQGNERNLRHCVAKGFLQSEQTLSDGTRLQLRQALSSIRGNTFMIFAR
jgi:hypothetical protein